MHDPNTLAFNVKLPLPWKRPAFPEGAEWASLHLANIWHLDPCKGRGGDDSCGWFMRAHPGNPQVLAKIEKRFAEDWDRTFKSDSGKTYFCGYFEPHSGLPAMSVSGIVLNLFFLACIEHFKSDGRTNWKVAKRFCQDNLFDILLFAENPTDSMRDGIIQKWGNDRNRDDRIKSMAACVYGWILRATRPWYRHPRWHVHHWRIQIPLWQYLKRGLFERCAICHKGFKFGESVYGSWSGNSIYHERCQNHPPVEKS